MKIPYYSKSGKESGVKAYEIGNDSITVFFQSGDKYIYTYCSAGEEMIETMKSLAERGMGLSSYISRFDPPYEKKWINMYKDSL